MGPAIVITHIIVIFVTIVIAVNSVVFVIIVITVIMVVVKVGQSSGVSVSAETASTIMLISHQKEDAHHHYCRHQCIITIITITFLSVRTL